MLKNKDFSCFQTIRYVVFIMLINVKMPTIVGILTFTSMIKFMLKSVEHKKKLYNLKARAAGPFDFKLGVDLPGIKQYSVDY